MIQLRLFIIIFACAVFGVCGHSQANTANGNGKKRLKVGLVLGGGGAKGAAEIGVLKVIEEVGIPVDFIAGTSIGAINGGLYSVGYRAADLDSLFRNQEWLNLFVSGNIMEMLAEKTGISDSICFDDMPIPFRCVAMNIKEGKEVVLNSGNPAHAMRASMSIPGIFKPVKYNGMTLVDGGMMNNLPVDVVKAMGADVVIAIDLTQKKHDTRDFSLKEKLGIGGILDWVVSRPDWKKYNINRKTADIYINPNLKGYGAMSFNKDNISEMIEIGYEEAEKHKEQFIKLMNRLENE